MPSNMSPSEITWNPDTIRALGLSRILTRILGIWPLDSQNLFATLQVFVVSVLEVSMAISLVREIKGDCVAVDEIVNFLALVACSVIALMKVLVLKIDHSRMELLIKSIVEDWSRVEDSESRGVMRSHASTGRFVFVFQMGSATLTTMSLVINSLPLGIEPMVNNGTGINEHNNSSSFASSGLLSLLENASSASLRTLPMGTGCFVADLPSFLYIMYYIVQVIQLVSTCCGNVGTDVYFFGLTMHVCAQFEILKTRFETFGQEPDKTKCRKELAELVKRHNHLVTLTNNFENTFNLIILAQLSANALHMSLLGVQVIISMKAGNGVAVAGALMAFYVLSLQLYLYSYAGEYLSTQTEKIRDAVYHSPWYELPAGVVKDLVFVMSKSNSSFHLTAGKVYSMNMDNFKNIFKAMGSYFSMLRIMFDA